MTELPAVLLLPKRDRRARGRYPWIFSNEIDMTARVKALPPGTLVTVRLANGQPVGTAMFNPRSLIGLRMLTPEPDARIDQAFLTARLEAALRLRARLFDEPHYRLVHAEADGLPGLVIDRYGDALSVQIGAAGMDLLREPLLAALQTVLTPRAIVLRNDAPARALEGLPREVTMAAGTLDGPVTLRENGLDFRADLTGGQKTGWFYDQRENRAAVAALARDARVLDLYCHTGGFALTALARGAAQALGLDGSADALALAAEAAGLNGLAGRATWRKADAFDALTDLVAAGERFDVVVCDPPAFAKARKDVESAARGYRRLARLAAQTVAPEGLLFIASCSHAMETERFISEVAAGLVSAGRSARILRQTGAGPDHPVHPLLPETAYLKALLLALD